MTESTRPPSAEPPAGPAGHLHEVSPEMARAMFGSGAPWIRDFTNLNYEWRRLTADLWATFFLVLVAAGGRMVGALSGGAVGRTEQVAAPAVMVMAIVLATGAVLGAHLNPVVTVAFALRRDFPWRRAPGYVVAQAVGGLLACLFLWALFGRVGHLGATVPGPHVDDVRAMLVEAVLTFGLVTTILGTASGAQNVGPLSAIGVAGYIALAGLWSSPVTGASMNPVRSLALDLVLWNFDHFCVYVAGPVIGTLVAVGLAYILRGRAPDAAAARAAQGALGAIIIDPARERREGPPEGPASGR